MAFNADLQILTQPGSTGNQTYSLASNFDPKAVILWAVPMTADGTQAHYSIGYGFGTYRSSTVQERSVSMYGTDAAATSNLSTGLNNNALLSLFSDGNGTRDLEIDLISMQTGGTSQVVLNWVNLHTTASIRVYMLVLGGSEISDALVGDFTTGTASTTKDVTVVASFGKPELIFFLGLTQNGFADFGATVNSFSVGFGKQGEAGRMFAFAQADANTNSVTSCQQRSDRVLGDMTSAGGQLCLARLDTTVANWPTDGFRMLFDANPTFNDTGCYLALRTTAQIVTGSNGAVTAGSPPVNQDNACGFAPKLGFNFGWNLAASSSIQTTATDQVGFGIGAYDGTDMAWAGFTEDDAAGTMVSKSETEADHFNVNYDVTPTLQSSATASFSGNNLRLSWDDIDSVAREYQWLAMGDAAGGGSVKDLTPSSVSITFAEAATLVKTAVLTATDNIRFTEAATLVKTAVLAPSTSLRFTETATLVKTAVFTPSTNIRFTEAATLVATRVFVPIANITFTETANLVRVAAAAPTKIAQSFFPAIAYLMGKWR